MSVQGRKNDDSDDDRTSKYKRGVEPKMRNVQKGGIGWIVECTEICTQIASQQAMAPNIWRAEDFQKIVMSLIAGRVNFSRYGSRKVVPVW